MSWRMDDLARAIEKYFRHPVNVVHEVSGRGFIIELGIYRYALTATELNQAPGMHPLLSLIVGQFARMGAVPGLIHHMQPYQKVAQAPRWKVNDFEVLDADQHLYADLEAARKQPALPPITDFEIHQPDAWL